MGSGDREPWNQGNNQSLNKKEFSLKPPGARSPVEDGTSIIHPEPRSSLGLRQLSPECASSGVALQSTPKCHTCLGHMPPRLTAVPQRQATDPAILFPRKLAYTPKEFHRNCVSIGDFG